MRIAHVITLSDPIGGAQVHVRDLSDAFIKRGHACEVFIGAEGILTDWLRDLGIRYHIVPHLRHPIDPRSDFLAVRALTRQLAEFRPDVVSTHSSKAGIVGRLAAKRLGLPSVYTVHGWIFLKSTGKLTAFLGWRAEKHCAKFTRKIITVSEHDRRFAVDRKLCDPSRIVAVHNGIPDVASADLADPGRNAPETEIVMVARFAAQKDHDTLLQALAKIKDRPWRLTLVGDGPDEQKVRGLVSLLGLGDRVVFTGAVRSVQPILQQAQIFVLTSRSEGLPISIIEAMRTGLPIVSNRLAGIPEQVEEGENGFLLETGDVEGVADRLARLIDDPRLRAHMGQASRRLYLERFTIDRLVEQTLQVLADAVSGR